MTPLLPPSGPSLPSHLPKEPLTRPGHHHHHHSSSSNSSSKVEDYASTREEGSKRRHAEEARQRGAACNGDNNVTDKQCHPTIPCCR
ncbi:hypothetical protein INR49_017915 [Caranx melampygus]|nr:hypothetical protein INR49_017915 [Caranx melampygus]